LLIGYNNSKTLIIKLNKFFLPMAIVVIPVSCESTQNAATQTTTHVNRQETSVPFTVAQNYFVRNDAPALTENKITDRTAFDRYFGTATTMGTAGKPTPIDFSNRYAIALTLPETDTAVTITPVNLARRNDGQLILRYKINRGAKQSFMTVPNLIVLVDADQTGNVILEEIR